MIKIDKVEVFGWEAAIRGMRNPMNSWDKSDSKWVLELEEERELDHAGEIITQNMWKDKFEIGENDLRLMVNLSKAGSDHGKFLRMINVTLEINAPLYWWKEFDTYKVGTVANSCSTMHKIHDKEFTLDDFSHEHLNEVDEDLYKVDATSMALLVNIVETLNHYRRKYLEAKVKPLKEEAKRATLMKHYWWQMIQLLPSSYNQKRTVQLNYQVLKTMYHARKNHKLDEWREFCKWCETLPYFKEICINE